MPFGTRRAALSGRDSLDPIRRLGPCEVLIDAIAGVRATNPGTLEPLVLDLSGKGRKIAAVGSSIGYTSTTWNSAQPGMSTLGGQRFSVNLPIISLPMTAILVSSGLARSTPPATPGGTLFQNHGAATPIVTGFLADAATGNWGMNFGTSFVSTQNALAAGRHITILVANGANSVVSQDDTEETGDSGAGGTLGGTPAAGEVGAVGIGAVNTDLASTQNRLFGTWAFVALFSRALSSADRQFVRTYLRGRYSGL